MTMHDVFLGDSRRMLVGQISGSEECGYTSLRIWIEMRTKETRRSMSLILSTYHLDPSFWITHQPADLLPWGGEIRSGHSRFSPWMALKI